MSTGVRDCSARYPSSPLAWLYAPFAECCSRKSCRGLIPAPSRRSLRSPLQRKSCNRIQGARSNSSPTSLSFTVNAESTPAISFSALGGSPLLEARLFQTFSSSVKSTAKLVRRIQTPSHSSTQNFVAIRDHFNG
jgi:hypothetical protein